MVCDLWFIRFFVFKVRRFWTLEFGGVFLKGALSFTYGFTFFIFLYNETWQV